MKRYWFLVDFSGLDSITYAGKNKAEAMKYAKQVWDTKNGIEKSLAEHFCISYMEPESSDYVPELYKPANPNMESARATYFNKGRYDSDWE